MATPVVARFRDPAAEAGTRRWAVLLGIMAMAAVAILMFVGASLGTLYAVVLVLGLFAVVAMGVLFGPLGLVLGYPLAVVVDVAVRRLYVRETLGESVEIAGEKSRKRRHIG